jgi:hypothetical protein
MKKFALKLIIGLALLVLAATSALAQGKPNILIQATSGSK